MLVNFLQVRSSLVLVVTANEIYFKSRHFETVRDKLSFYYGYI